MSSNQLVGQGTKGVDKVGKGSMLAGRAQGMSMGVMMGLPMVGGLARGMGMQESTAAGVEKGLGFAAMGASTGNPYLMAAGAIAGVVTGTFDVFKGWRSELAEFNKEAEEGKEKLTKFGNSVQEYIKAHEAYAKAIVDPDIKVDQLKAREDATIDALAEIPAEFRNKIVTAATQGGDALQRTFDEINKTLQATSKELDTAANLQKQYEDSDTFMNWLTGAVGDNMFNAPAANMIESVTAKKNVNAVVAATIAAAKRRDPDMFKDPAKGRAWKGQWTYPHGIKAQNNQKTLGNFRRAGIDPMLIRVIEQGLKDDVTANTALVNAIRQRATEEMNAAQEAKKLAAIIKANKLASDTFFKNMQALGKQLENFHRNLKSLTDNMAERVKSRNKIKYEQDDTQREMAKMIIQSDQQLFKPFMFKRDQDSMSGGSAKMTLGLAKIIDKQMRAVRAAGDKSQNAALSVFQKEMRAASKLITDTQLKAAREGKALGAVERRKVKIAEQTQIKYSAIIASHLSDMAANPGKILDTSQINRVAKDLRVAGRTTQEIDMVINELKLIKTQATAAYAEAQNQRNMQTALLELQAENQEKLIRIQESLKFGGGVAGFMSKDRIWETRKGTEKRFAGELGPDAGLEIGRQNLNILSELVNDFGINISKSLDTYGPMVASAVSSLQSSLNRRLTEIGERNKSAALWSGWGVRPSDMQSLPQEGSDRAKEIVSAIDTQMEEAKKQSLDAAVNQVAAQLKLQNMPKDIEQIRINTSILQELYSSQWVQMKQTNFEAHKAALEAVGMTGQSLAGRITDVNNEGFKSLNENLRSLEKMMHRGLGISASIEDLREADKLRTEGRRQATMMTPEELQFEDKRLEYETTKQSLQDKKENLAHDLFKGIDADTLDSFHKELVAQGKHGEAAKMKKAMANLAGDVVGDLSPWWDLLGFVGIYRMWAKVLTTQDMESLDPDMKDLIAQGGMLGAAGKVADQSRLEADILGKTKQLAGVDLQIQSMLKTHPELIGKQRGGTTEETTMWRLLVEQENLKSEITIQTEELKLLKPKLQDLINKANEANENSRKLRKTLDEPILKELEKIEKDFDRLFPKKTSNRPDATEDREVASLLRGGLYGSPAVIPRYLPKIDKDLTQVQRAIEDQETQFVIDGDPTPKTRGHKDRLERHRQKRLDTEGRLRGGGPTGTRLGYNQFPLRSATTPKFQDVAGAGTPPIVPVAPAPVTPAPRAITPRPAAPVVGSSGVGSTGAPMFPGKFPEGAQDHGWKILQAYAAKARELYADQGEDKQNKAAEAAIKYARAQHKLNRPMVSLSVLKNTSGGVEVKPGHPRDPEALIPGLAIRQRPSFGDLQQQTNYNAIKQKAYSAALVHKEVFREGASPASTAQNWRGYQSRDSEGGAAGGGFTGYSLDVDRREIATRNERVAKLQEKLKAFREDPIKWEREHGILKEYHDAEMIEDYKKLEAALKKQWEITPDAVQGGLIPKMSDHDVLKNLLGEKNLGGLFPSLLTQEHSYRGAGIPHYIQGGPSAERDEVSGGSSGLPFSTRGKLKAQTHGLIERQIGHDLAASYETVLAIQGTKKKSKGVPALHGINIDDPDQKAKDTAALKYHALGMQGNYLYEGKKPTMEMRLGHETRVKALMERQKFLDEKYKVKGKGDKEYTLTNQIQAYQVAAEEALEKEKEINSKGGMINATADDKKILENHRKRRDDLKYEINSRIKFEEDRALKLNHSFQGQLAAIRKLKKLNAAETELIKERQRMMKLIKKTQGKPEIDMVGALRELRIFDLDRIDKQIKEKQGEFNRAEFSGLENDTELAKIKDAELNLRWKKAMARGGATMLGTTTDGRISTATSFPNDPNQRQFIPGAKALPENMRIDYSRPGYPGYHTGAVSTRRRGTLQQPLGGSAGVGPLGFMGGPKGSTLVRPPEAVAISQTGEVSLPHLQSLADKAKQEDRGYDEKVLRDMIDILKETHRNFYRSMQGELNDMRLELIKLSVAPKTQENLGKKARLAETEARKSMESLELGGYQDNLQMMFQRAGIQEQDYKDIMKLLPKWMQDRLGQAAGNKFKPGIGKIFERPEGEDGTFWTPDQIHGLGGMGPGMELGTGVSEGIAFRQIMAKFMNARLDAFDNEFTGLLYDNMWLQWDPTASMEQKLKTRGAINSARIRNYEIQFGEIFDETIDNEKAVAERKKIIEEYAQIQRENLSERIRKLDKEISLMSNDPTLFQQERVGKMRQRTKERLRALGDPNAAQEDKYTIGDTMDNIIESYKYGSKEMALQAEEGVWKLSQDFQSATSKAFTEAILGAKTLEEAFSDMFQNLAEHAVAQIVDIATKRFLFNTLAGIMGNKGGLATEGGFKRYARGGEVQGGSGTRDDVPALLQRGEYVIKQASAKKYGLSLLDLINSGAYGVPKRMAQGGYLQGESGRAYHGMGRVQGNPASNDPMYVVYPDGRRVAVDDMESIRRGRGLPTYTHTDPDPGLFEKRQYKVDYWRHLSEPTTHGGMGMDPTEVAKLKRQWEENAFADPVEGLRSKYTGDDFHADIALRNAFVYDSDKFPTTRGSYYSIDSRLSRRALTDQNNPRNAIRMKKVDSLFSYFKARQDELKQWREDVQEARDKRKKSMKNLLYFAAGASLLGYMMGEDMWGVGSKGGGKDDRNFFQRIMSGDFGAGGRKQGGGGRRGRWGRLPGGMRGGRRQRPIRGGWPSNSHPVFGGGGTQVAATGGFILGNMVKRMAGGGTIGEDNIPALLTGGEYVISKDAVNKYGVDFFHNLNRGQQEVHRFAKGGPVLGEGFQRNASATPVSGGDIKNDIIINVNVDQTGGVTSDVTSSGSEPMSDKKAKGLAIMIKQQVVKTLVEQKRQGGMFDLSAMRRNL
jgi:hypothetical protein